MGLRILCVEAPAPLGSRLLYIGLHQVVGSYKYSPRLG